MTYRQVSDEEFRSMSEKLRKADERYRAKFIEWVSLAEKGGLPTEVYRLAKEKDTLAKEANDLALDFQRLYQMKFVELPDQPYQKM